MPDISIMITNLPQIKLAFAKAPSRMRSALSDAINKSTLAIGRQAVINAPVRTGRLRGSFFGTGGFGDSSGLVLATADLLTGSIGPTANYGVFVEEGTRFMRGQHYLRRAVDSQDVIVQGFFLEAVNKVLDDTGAETKL